MKKSKFNLSHNASLTADMGKLIPFCVLDCLPGDSIRLKLQSFVRAQPMLAPLMHQVNLYTQYWFVPYRIVWDDWTDFITGGIGGYDTPTFPTMLINSKTSSLADYFGIPITDTNTTLEVNALPFRAYAEIWNTRYRDEDLQAEVGITKSSGRDFLTNSDLLSCSWAKDYFTTARPFTQRGSQISTPVLLQSNNAQTQMGTCKVSVSGLYPKYDAPLPDYIQSITYDTMHLYMKYYWFEQNLLPRGSINILLQNGPIDIEHLGRVDGVETQKWTVHAGFDNGNIGLVYTATIKFIVDKMHEFEGGAFGDVPIRRNFDLTFNVTEQKSVDTATVNSLLDWTYSQGWTEATNYTIDVGYYLSTGGMSASLNIRDLRLSSALQRYQERSLEYGNRYEEFLQREFGVRPRDSRIQRPEYLGGGKSVLQISEVLQTAEGNNTGVGTMRGHGVSTFSSRGIRFRCPEHGLLIGLLSIRPHADYTQGLRKFWRKFSKLDYFVPELANIGMQEVFETELFANGTIANYDKLFGYVPRYEEYRHEPNRISGEFRDILNYWNLARIFDAPPVLNSDFIRMNPSKRIFAEQTQNSFLIMLRNNIRAYRNVPKKAVNILK